MHSNQLNKQKMYITIIIYILFYIHMILINVLFCNNNIYGRKLQIYCNSYIISLSFNFFLRNIISQRLQ